MPEEPYKNRDMFTAEQRQEIKHIVAEALAEYFSDTGMVMKNVLFTAAGVVGALVVISGGVKSLLTWIGFVYTR